MWDAGRTYYNPSESVIKLQLKRVVISLIVTSTLPNTLSDITEVRQLTSPFNVGGAVGVEFPQQYPIITMDVIQIIVS